MRLMQVGVGFSYFNYEEGCHASSRVKLDLIIQEILRLRHSRHLVVDVVQVPYLVAVFAMF